MVGGGTRYLPVRKHAAEGHPQQLAQEVDGPHQRQLPPVFRACHEELGGHGHSLVYNPRTPETTSSTRRGRDLTSETTVLSRSGNTHRSHLSVRVVTNVSGQQEDDGDPAAAGLAAGLAAGSAPTPLCAT